MFTMPLLGHQIAQHAAGTTTVVTSGVSGLELGGTIGGVVAATVAVITLGLSIAANSSKKKKDSEAEIQDAREAARKEERVRFNDMMRERDQRIDDLNRDHQREVTMLAADRDFYRSLYFTMSSGARPVPPSEQGRPE